MYPLTITEGEFTLLSYLLRLPSSTTKCVSIRIILVQFRSSYIPNRHSGTIIRPIIKNPRPSPLNAVHYVVTRLPLKCQSSPRFRPDYLTKYVLPSAAFLCALDLYCIVHEPFQVHIHSSAAPGYLFRLSLIGNWFNTYVGPHSWSPRVFIAMPLGLIGTPPYFETITSASLSQNNTTLVCTTP